jgi:hypothetical protein
MKMSDSCLVSIIKNEENAFDISKKCGHEFPGLVLHILGMDLQIPFHCPKNGKCQSFNPSNPLIIISNYITFIQDKIQLFIYHHLLLLLP